MAGSKRMQNLINALLKTGHNNIANLIVKNPNESLPQKTVGEINAVKYELLEYTIKNPFSFIPFYRRAFKFVKASKSSQFKNILYCYDTPTFINYPIIRYAKRKGYKVVVDIVEDYALTTQSLGLKQKFMANRQVSILKKLPDYASGVIAISKYLNNKMVKETDGRIPVFHLPVTVNFSFFKARPAAEKNSIKIFYGGSFGEKDGLLYLLNAFEQVAEKHVVLELILTGRPPQVGMAHVTDFLAHSKFKERIHFMGYLSDMDYYALMNSCDIFCMTRVSSGYAQAGFPFKLGEMLAAGKPVIATNISNVSDYLINKQNALLISPDSTEEIVEALLFILSNKDESLKIGEAGRETARRYFDTDELVNDLEQFLLKI